MRPRLDSHSLVVAQQDLVGSKITVGSTDLNLGDVLLGETVGSVETEQVLSNGQRGHSVDVVGDTTESRSALPGGEGLRGDCQSGEDQRVVSKAKRSNRVATHLPPRGVPLSGVETSPVHETGSVLVGPKEQDLGILASGKVDDLFLDSRGLTGNEQVDDGVDKVFKAEGKVGIEVGQDGSLGTSFDD